MASLQPIKIYGKHGPNPPKVAMLCNELSVPYEVEPVSFPDLKKPDFLAVNPNGRMPAIHDPNTGLTLWESGAIIEYLVEKYDKDQKLSFAPGSPESYLAKQWLFFQGMHTRYLLPPCGADTNIATCKYPAKAHTTAKQSGSQSTTLSSFPRRKSATTRKRSA